MTEHTTSVSPPAAVNSAPPVVALAPGALDVKHQASVWSTRDKVRRVAWMVVRAILFRPSFHNWYGWRRFVLRLMGAKVGAGVRVRETARIEIPWNLEIGKNTVVGDEAILYSLGKIRLGRKVIMNGGKALMVLAERINETVLKAGHVEGSAEHANALAEALKKIGNTTKAAWSTGVPEEALANATPYLQAFGHTVLAWIWLELALAAKAAQAKGEWAKRPEGAGFLKGKLGAADYFFHYELPKIDAWLKVVANRDQTCAQAEADWF